MHQAERAGETNRGNMGAFAGSFRNRPRLHQSPSAAASEYCIVAGKVITTATNGQHTTTTKINADKDSNDRHHVITHRAEPQKCPYSRYTQSHTVERDRSRLDFLKRKRTYGRQGIIQWYRTVYFLTWSPGGITKEIMLVPFLLAKKTKSSRSVAAAAAVRQRRRQRGRERERKKKSAFATRFSTYVPRRWS